MSMMKSLDRSNATMNHPLTANCLRKCAYWQLTISDSTSKKSVKLSKNSGIALRQMNYESYSGLTKEELKLKKDSLKIPG